MHSIAKCHMNENSVALVYSRLLGWICSVGRPCKVDGQAGSLRITWATCKMEAQNPDRCVPSSRSRLAPSSSQIRPSNDCQLEQGSIAKFLKSQSRSAAGVNLTLRLCTGEGETGLA